MSAKKKKIRENFRNAVFTRDGYKCVFCDITNCLDAHHITDRNEMPNGGYVKENGITLCPEHHVLAEIWHETNGELYEEGFTPEDLYIKINSSLEKAQTASLRI